MTADDHQHSHPLIVKLKILPPQLAQPVHEPSGAITTSGSDADDPQQAPSRRSVPETTSEASPTKRVKVTKKRPNPSPSHSSSATPQLPPNYLFAADTALPTVEMELRKDTVLRGYQSQAVESIVPPYEPGTARSGIVVLPCGAGKTLVAIAAACKIRKSTLVVCASNIAADQFHREWVRFSSLNPGQTGMFAGERKFPWNGVSGGVLFTTYAAITNSRPGIETRRMKAFIENEQSFGLIVLDEVHVVPAATFSRAILNVRASCRLGLTATMLREDDGIADLDSLVGPVLFQARWRELADLGHIAHVRCMQVVCPMAPIFGDAYVNTSLDSTITPLSPSAHIRSLLSILNPNKFQTCQRLVHYHESRGDKILLFSDHLFPLHTYAEALNRPFIDGQTSADMVSKLLELFRKTAAAQPNLSYIAPSPYGGQFNTLCLSRIGDSSLDLPEATVLIQVSSHFGSRRQEAQRLGRILRAKRRTEDGFHSMFYTLVSDGTDEVYFSEKRRQYLEEECGYEYRCLTEVEDNIGRELVEREGGLAFVTEEQQKWLRDQILSLKKVEIEESEIVDSDFEAEAEAVGAVSRGGTRGKGRGKGKRKTPVKQGVAK
ncbi:P-loop containing nucleoside triphosphate hydrolase protein [Endogone sp. FLAS-F59071]|nr:P-loop containing nucleoside triphosphate hydrolase protein [Endogone sp. FLAS-F59071]|eukprot:RUS17858.1 P-loop containing nucleoside triphosphate hydrolase protein [Endogone sp. FLAS-F59071]